MKLNCSLNASIALKNLLEGNTGDQEKVHLLCLSSYVENYCPIAMNISYAHASLREE